MLKNITTKHSHRLILVKNPSLVLATPARKLSRSASPFGRVGQGFTQIITELSGREAELASVYIISVRFNKDKMLSVFFGRNVEDNTFILYFIGSYLVYNLLFI